MTVQPVAIADLLADERHVRRYLPESAVRREGCASTSSRCRTTSGVE
jgi:hypothetical protein